MTKIQKLVRILRERYGALDVTTKEAATVIETQSAELTRLRSYLWAIRRRAARDDVSATDAIGVLAAEALGKVV